ncbi:LacI family DNA-binding transcriptional regulator [Corynebacterium bovis]|uniref:DNA-binding LacI/PurR family transcriptional regulator n=1 Tax=Corynebacterium bovis DSM 20582 = CIP 54.80 TaxID=927655 RepID=A0A8I0CM80_9CORY|nr:LacI family DNA-binding transcriptional regulator [Corynebacterium bovis]MBB3115424.1 DNA-binding LacI/PurR family transcriptional regulator [Corynebacterium bovis DSM 20582 = CIP 54.80]WJY78229.1 HTH-type transcriptional repressor CytR [Corynebacterium bovis DSM 20582 = CIP 54.80]
MNTPRTLASLAAELGVSRTTVSNAYNRPDQLSESLRARILAAAERAGYPGPDPTARSLRTRHAGALGVLLTEDLTYAFEDQASLEFMSGVSVACSGRDTSMLLVPAGAETQGDGRAAALVNQAAVDGFIVYSVAADDPFLAAVRGRGVPTVVCDQPADGHDLTFVGIDDREAVRPAVRALVDAGHRRVGVLCIRLAREPNNGPVGPERLAAAQMHVQRSRVEGALAELAAAGVVDVPVVERHINTPETARDAARELLDAHPDLTAVVCTTDSMALGVLDVAGERGLDVPGDLSVTGFDGIPRAVARGVTTVVQPSREKGLASGRALFALLDGEEPPRRRLLGTRFRPGRTVAPPR